MDPHRSPASTSPTPTTPTGLLARSRRRLGRARRQVLLHRRLLAALAVGSAVLLGFQAASPPPTPTARVWTAARDLPSGTLVSLEDLTPVDYPPAVVPAGAVRDPRGVVGRLLAAPLGRGEPLVTGRVLDARLLAGYPGDAAVPLRITDAASAALLRVGDRIDLVAADPQGRAPSSTLVSDVPVVAVPTPERDAGVGTPGRLVVVAVPSAQAADVAARAATAVLIPVWNR